MLLILMIALLPLRGWAVEHMAVQMAAGSLAAAVGEVQAAAMPADCPMMELAFLPGERDQSDALGAKSCPTCQLCMGLAVEVLPAAAVVFMPPATRPGVETASFASADLVQPHKPPIL